MISALTFCACTVPVPVPRYLPDIPKSDAATRTPSPQQLLPAGWADITTRSKQPQIKQWLINKDQSATMVLRELQADSATKRLLMNEEINHIATISLHSRLSLNDPEIRITRVPIIIDLKRNFSSYVYSEKGLLRRVVVFRKKDVIMELELMQERSTTEFDVLTNDAVQHAISLYER